MNKNIFNFKSINSFLNKKAIFLYKHPLLLYLTYFNKEEKAKAIPEGKERKYLVLV